MPSEDTGGDENFGIFEPFSHPKDYGMIFSEDL